MKNLARMLAVFTVVFFLKASAHAELFNVTNLNDAGPGSLRDAVLKAQKGDDISIIAKGTIVLKSTISIDKNISVEVPKSGDVIISGNGSIRPFTISADVTLFNLHIVNGKTELGGALSTSGKVILENCTLTMNNATEGGALYITETGWVVLQNSAVVKNFASVSGTSALKSLGTIEVGEGAQIENN
ncbi:MAG: hypothetical protein V4642_06525 [Bacteroidota bacterium]